MHGASNWRILEDMATYLITGGAGFLGINLARFLLQRGHEVVSLDLADFDYPDVRHRVTVHQGDIRDRAAVDRAMEGVDVVVHAAAALPLYSKEQIYTTDITGTGTVVDSAYRHNVDTAGAIMRAFEKLMFISGDSTRFTPPASAVSQSPRRKPWHAR